MPGAFAVVASLRGGGHTQRYQQPGAGSGGHFLSIGGHGRPPCGLTAGDGKAGSAGSAGAGRGGPASFAGCWPLAASAGTTSICGATGGLTAGGIGTSPGSGC